MLLNRAVIGILLLFITGCSVIPDTGDWLAVDDAQQLPMKQRAVSDKTLHQHVESMVIEMLSNSQTQLNGAAIAVGTFVHHERLSNAQQLPNHRALGSQIQDSLVSILTQLNFPVLEFKTTEAIQIEAEGDYMLSRDISRLKQTHDIGYFLTGTVNQTDTGYYINTRLIDTNTQHIQSAASYFVPINVMFAEQNSSWRDGMIYRGEQ